MKLFVGNFTRKEHLSKLAKHLRRHGYHYETRYKKVKLKTGQRRYYAIVTVESERHAKKLTKRLSAVREFDSPLVIREYKQRSYSNERRALNWRDKEWNGVERRVSERRRLRKKRRSSDETSEQTDDYQVEIFNGIRFDR
jgi:uncharacterized protein with PIN domain